MPLLSIVVMNEVCPRIVCGGSVPVGQKLNVKEESHVDVSRLELLLLRIL